MGILFVLRSGIPWEMLPQEMRCGSGMTCWRRLRDWNEAGVWRKLHEVLLEGLQAAAAIGWSRAALDASSVPARSGDETGSNPAEVEVSGARRGLQLAKSSLAIPVSGLRIRQRTGPDEDAIRDAVLVLHQRHLVKLLGDDVVALTAEWVRARMGVLTDHARFCLCIDLLQQVDCALLLRAWPVTTVNVGVPAGAPGARQVLGTIEESSSMSVRKRCAGVPVGGGWSSPPLRASDNLSIS